MMNEHFIPIIKFNSKIKTYFCLIIFFENKIKKLEHIKLNFFNFIYFLLNIFHLINPFYKIIIFHSKKEYNNILKNIQ